MFTFQEFSYLKILFFYNTLLWSHDYNIFPNDYEITHWSYFFKVYVVVIVLFLTLIVLLDHLGLSLVLLFLLYV